MCYLPGLLESVPGFLDAGIAVAVVDDGVEVVCSDNPRRYVLVSVLDVFLVPGR